MVCKQYILKEGRWPYYYIYLYKDGVKIDIIKCDQTNLDHHITEVECQGYNSAYLREEVEAAKEKYEKMINNQLMESKGD